MPTPKASLELPPQLKWTFANEPKILEWSIKARNYNTRVANSLFTIMLFVTFGLSLFLYSAYHDLDQVWRISACATFFILTTLTVSLMTHQKMNFAYRLTNTGIEYCKWKTLPKLTKKSLMYLATITTIILIFLAIIDPYLLVGALVGPGGMGLTYLLMLNSKNYNEMHTQHHHYAYKWGEITQVAIATNREVIDLQYSVIQEGDTHTTNWNLNVFCIKNEKNSIAKIIKSHLSTNIPFINAKVNVPMSTD